ncbi:MAG TPA: penicillin-binding protein 2 [Firmicutes bacterium]|nr:penicillin-binding protein 2 [Bacillota bacterium]
MTKVKKKKKKNHLPLRLNILFFAVFLLFSLMIVRLGVVQLVHGETFREEVERTEDITIGTMVPRGKIMDRNQNVVVDNNALNAIIYTRYPTTTSEQILETATKLSKLITMKTDRITERDRKDYWILLHPEEAKEKITKEEWALFEEGELEDQDLYRLQLDRITEEEQNSFTKEELQILAIKREMDSGYALTQIIIKSDVTEREYARVSENLALLPGVDIATDWERGYPYDETLRSVLGKVTTRQEGLPSEKVDYYVSRGYSRNDRVGKSYIEMQYEDVLFGKKGQIQNITDKAGNVLSSTIISEGEAGKDLILSLDINLQIEVEKIIEEELAAAKGRAGNHMLDRAFVVMMNPKTGEVLSLAGKQYTKENGKTVMKDFALGTITTSYPMGSAVKGATLLTGYETGAIQPNTVFYDAPLVIKGTPPKASYRNMGNVNDLTALRLSSNVYMFHTVIKIGKGQYIPNGPLSLSADVFDTLRYYFSQFGLGVKTGIDLPNESIGFKNTTETSPGLALDMGIGQYDNYTPLQLAQYVSTIANDGYRMQPQILKEIHDPEKSGEGTTGKMIYSSEPKVLNRIDMKKEYIDRVKEGFRQAFQESGGTAYSHFNLASAPYSAAGKTGTAETRYYGPNESYRGSDTYNLTLVGYAPHDDPEVSFSIVVPWVNDSDQINKNIGKRIMDAYFELKEKGSKS